MERIDRILQNPLYREYVAKNRAAEADRCFCRHDMVHFMDVARIAEILNLEEQLMIPKEMLYAAALLHDIGRHVQYDTGKPHEIAGFEMAPAILRAAGFTEEEVEQIADAILQHRNVRILTEKTLRGILYRADKLSRPCFACEVQEQCDWKQSKKNMVFRY